MVSEVRGLGRRLRVEDVTLFFFFQAEDGIRDDLVTGVQTCALPICSTISSTASRVVPGIGETIARSEAVRQFSSVDLPTLGWPMIAILTSCRASSIEIGRASCRERV